MEGVLKILFNGIDANEPDSVKQHRLRAHDIISDASPTTFTQCLNDILIQVIKPLFSKSHHPGLTSTGRRNLVSQPTLPNRFESDPIFDEPLWKTSWTTPLLKYTLKSHNQIPEAHERKKAIEANFHLLIPALLHLIDDADIDWKVDGCECLTSLCELLVEVKSEILKRTGLTDVFVEALKHCFHYLPSLTSEDESLKLMQALYPSWLALGEARFITLDEVNRDHKAEEQKNNSITTKPTIRDDIEIITIRSNTKTTKTQPSKPNQQQSLTPTQISSETHLRTQHYTTLLRHSLLHSLSHLSRHTPQAGSTPTSSVPLSTFFLLQLSTLLHTLRIDASIHLQSIIPLLSAILRDPFMSHAPAMLAAGIAALEAMVCVCWVRVRERWWMDILRACVDCYMNLQDDLDGVEDDQRRKELEELGGRVRRCVAVLADVAGGDFGTTVEVLIAEEEELKGLFTWP